MDFKCGKYALVFVTHLIAVTLIVKLAGCICPCLSVEHYTWLIELLACFGLALLTFRFAKQRYLDDKVHPNKKAVLVTGCDSGFGHGVAKRLDSEGFRVFACCLFPDGEGAKELRKNCSKKLEVVELDVTKDESVKKAVEHVKQNLGKDVLWALINNAGMTTGFTVDLSPIKAFQDCLEVNSIAPVRVTKAFLPFLKKSKGRVVNLTSIAGRQIFPFVTAYNMSKYAAAAFTDCLRVELEVWGIKVISIEPDFFKTNLIEEQKTCDDFEKTIASADEEVKADYGEDYFSKIKDSLIKYIYFITSSRIDLVVDAIDSAVTDEYPSHNYRPSGYTLSKIFFYFSKHFCCPVNSLMFKSLAYVMGYPKPKAA
ncbi:hypothetical protein JTE90_011079 [Oedothorax gibbosus]|uniref:Estradiol 17-beta-dehydrogenase 2 n=1 Tax=Oedothorax gibbosus TaxID=931172 RepID=A0AAV6UL48_9ARAC|nr:hypothetical protein JTE90_011079 [Oedothorax gibbosus]